MKKNTKSVDISGQWRQVGSKILQLSMKDLKGLPHFIATYGYATRLVAYYY